jgi:hypothetical protein
MATFTLAGLALSSATVTLPRWGTWVADVDMVDPVTLSGAVELLVGDVVLRGTIVPGAGGSYVYSSSWTLVGGAGGWAKAVGPRAYRSDGGIPLSQVAADLAAEVGEQVVLEPGVDRDLGTAWSRMGGGTAADELAMLVGGLWWMAPDGVTHLGPRPVVPVPSTVAFVVENWAPTRKRARITSPDDTLAAFMPGGQWSDATVEGVQVVTSATLVVDGSAAWVEVLGSPGASESWSGLGARARRPELFLGFYLYEVQGADPGKPSLVAVEGPPGLPASVMPDQLAVTKCYGVPGVSSTLVAGAQVVLGFMGGNPARPFIALYMDRKLSAAATLPSSLQMDASGEIRLGGDAGPLAAARAPALQTWAGLVQAFLGDVKAQLLAAGHPTALTVPTLSNAVAATKVKVE